MRLRLQNFIVTYLWWDGQKITFVEAISVALWALGNK
jgi:hypothetical protein